MAREILNCYHAGLYQSCHGRLCDLDAKFGMALKHEGYTAMDWDNWSQADTRYKRGRSVSKNGILSTKKQVVS